MSNYSDYVVLYRVELLTGTVDLGDIVALDEPTAVPLLAVRAIKPYEPEVELVGEQDEDAAGGGSRRKKRPA